MTIKIGRIKISDSSVKIIAEAGVNHNGNLRDAKRLVKAAKKAGAHFIKFQTYKSHLLASPKAKKFWKKKGDKSKYQNQTYSRLDSFGYKEYAALKKYCDLTGIEFLSTPFDYDSLKILIKIGVSAIKVASCDINNLPFLEKICQTGLPIFLSTGASSFPEIKKAVKIIKSFGNKIILLHCILSYPTKIKDANLKSISFLRKKFPNTIVGFSDHTLGILASNLSIACGARVIEKHFTLQKNQDKIGDHWFASDPEELKQLANTAYQAFKSLGKDQRDVLPCEKSARSQARRSIFFSKSLKKGHILLEEDLICKRPGTGIPPYMLPKFTNKILIKNVQQDELLQRNMVK